MNVDLIEVPSSGGAGGGGGGGSGDASEAQQILQTQRLTSIDDKLAASLVPEAHDNIALTYVGLTTDIDTATFLLGAVPVATLQFTYDVEGRLTNVARV